MSEAITGMATTKKNVGKAKRKAKLEKFTEIQGEKQVLRPENALYQLNFTSLENPKDLQWQTAGSVKIDSENYNIFQNIFNATTSLLIQESGF